jgi:hypothetical protein
MRFLMLVMILVCTLAVYLSSQDVQWLPAAAKFLPEVLSLIAAVFVVLLGVHQNFRFVSAKYLLVFAALAVVIVCGILVNQVAPGPVLAGMRYYLRPIPFFFVPAVFDFSDKQIKQFMRWLLALALLQVPVAVYQRYTLAMTGHISGDHVFGTLMESGNLSIFLICVLCVAAALTLRGQMSKWIFLCLFLLLLVPMSINETKITVFALPLVLMLTMIVGSPRGKRLRMAAFSLTLIVVGGFIFVPVYDFFNTWNNDDPNHVLRIEDFLSHPDQIGTYLDTNATVGSRKEAGRVDAIVIPLQVISKTAPELGFGLGIGNTTKSSLGSQFSGRYEPVYGIYSVETSMATFMLETGIFGAFLVLFIHFMIFLDAVNVMRQDHGLAGIIALGWIGTSVVIGATLFYITIHTSETLSYMFWFFSGLIAAKRTRMALAQRHPHVQAIAA